MGSALSKMKSKFKNDSSSSSESSSESGSPRNKRRRVEVELEQEVDYVAPVVAAAVVQEEDSDPDFSSRTFGSSVLDSVKMDNLDDEYDDLFLQLDLDNAIRRGAQCSSQEGEGSDWGRRSFGSTTSTQRCILNEQGSHCNCKRGNCQAPLRAPTHALVEDFDRFSITQLLFRRSAPPTDASVGYEIRNEKEGSSTKLILRDIWTHSPDLQPGTIINICDCSPDENGDYVVERDFGFVIVEPDKLISVTNVVGMSWCERKIAFSEHFRFSMDNVDTLRGTLAHDLICQVMTKKTFGQQEIMAEVDTLLKNPVVMEKAYGLGLDHVKLKSLANELVNSIGAIKERMKPLQSGNKVSDRNQKLQILNVRDIEDCYWSPKYGIKGKVDCTVETIDHLGEKSVIPMEFKTGKPPTGRTDVRSEHLGQVYLYSLMMNKLDLVGPNGVLHYIRDMHTCESSAKMNVLQSLIMARNRIIMNIRSNSSSPGFSGIPRPSNVDFDRQCQRCEYRNICTLSLKHLTSGEESTDVVATQTETKLRRSLDYLTQTELDFFNKWLEIIKLEADDDELSDTVKNLWLKSISKRESSGKCVGYLTIKEQIIQPQSATTLVTFSISEDRRNFALNFAENEFVVIGTLADPCIGYSYIANIQQDSITVSLERPIGRRHVITGTQFTIDKVSSHNAGMMQYVYLSQMMENTPEAKRLRRRLIEKEEPIILDNITVDRLTPEFVKVLRPYNRTQRVAMMKSLATDSMILIKGSPGCGKTTTIIGIMQLLVMQNKSVLVSAYTSNALDNILLAYKKHSNDFIRIGSSGKLNQALLNEHCTNYIRETAETIDELRERYESTPVVGTTLLSTKHPILTSRTFDYCIIDEGSQAFPTVIIGALLKAKKYVVFGDPNQLPAIMKSRKVKALEVEDNIFLMLKETGFIHNLTVQYRMNQVLMKIANNLMYDNQMKCGSQGQAIEVLSYDQASTKQFLMDNFATCGTRFWLCVAVSRKPIRSIIYFDTELIGAYESVVASTLQNFKEKDIAVAIVRVLVGGCVIPVENIGVISPYRGQVHLIQDSLSKIGINVEVNTVDQYQGREKTVIVLSFAKSVANTENEIRSEDSILNDLRRLNVAITRAKLKVILIGNSGCLNKYPACNKLLGLLHEDTQIHKFNASSFSPEFFQKE